MIFLTNIPQYTICNKKCTHVHISITKWYIMGFLQHVYHPIASEATLRSILVIITLDSWVLHGSSAKKHGSTQKYMVRQKKNMVRHKNTLFSQTFWLLMKAPPSQRSGFDCIIRPAPSHNIPNCMKEVTWLMLCPSTNGQRSAGLGWLPFI